MIPVAISTIGKTRLGDYALVHITPELLGKERQLLADTPTLKGTKRTPSTINRYMASLSSLLTYATQQLRWISENPALRLKKLKENPGRDRVLSEEEIYPPSRCIPTKQIPYLYCIVLISLTTGARQGEILNLEWKHIDFENKIAYIKESKNGRPRSIALCDPVIKELKQLYQKRDPHKPLSLPAKQPLAASTSKKPGSRP